MSTTTPSAALIPVAAVFTNTERLALAGFLAGYSGLTREAYELDLRHYASWTTSRTPRGWTATSWALYWLPPGWARRASTP
jgi:hypothetical protein